jgi:hypothetical protein
MPTMSYPGHWSLGRQACRPGSCLTQLLGKINKLGCMPRCPVQKDEQGSGSRPVEQPPLPFNLALRWTGHLRDQVVKCQRCSKIRATATPRSVRSRG